MNTGRANPLSRGNRATLPYLILVLGFCFTVLVYYSFSKLSQEQDQINFERSVQEIQDQIRLRTETSIALLRSGTGLFAASDSVSAREFERFVRLIELDMNYPGVIGIGFARFTAGEKAKATIVYLQPENEPNQKALGFDMWGEEVRRRAMETARDSGQPTASGRVKLIQENYFADTDKQEGFLIYAPVYRNGVAPDTESDRRHALLGFVYS